MDSAVPDSGQPLVSYIKHNKQLENIYKRELPQNEKEVMTFFSENNWPALEAQKFYAHYSAIGWKIGGKIKIADWHASAKSWMLKAQELNLKPLPFPKNKEDVAGRSLSQEDSVRRSFSQEDSVRRSFSQEDSVRRSFSVGGDNLKTTKSKNYKEPL